VVRYGRSRSFKVIEIWISRKFVCALLLVFDCNYVCIVYCFRDITIYLSKISVFSPILIISVSFIALARVPLRPRVYESWCQKPRVPGLLDSDNRLIVRSLVLTHYQRVANRQMDGQTYRHTDYAYAALWRSWAWQTVSSFLHKDDFQICSCWCRRWSRSRACLPRPATAT